MALNGDRLGIAIYNAVLATKGAIDPNNPDPGVEAVWKAIGNEIVSEFTGNASVAVTIPKATAEIALNIPATPYSANVQPTNNPTGTGTIS